MATIEEYKKSSLQKYGFEAEDLHNWLESSIYFKGKNNIVYKKLEPNIIHNLPKKFIDEYGIESAHNIVIDHLILHAKKSVWKPTLSKEEYELRERKNIKRISRIIFWITLILTMIPLTLFIYISSFTLIVSIFFFIFSFLIVFSIWLIVGRDFLTKKL